jgi:hypothetical protein
MGSCPIGSEYNPIAMLDSEFRVRGVDGLRVIDASVSPIIPGAFQAVATTMVGQKSSEVILEDRKDGWERKRGKRYTKKPSNKSLCVYIFSKSTSLTDYRLPLGAQIKS